MLYERSAERLHAAWLHADLSIRRHLRVLLLVASAAALLAACGTAEEPHADAGDGGAAGGEDGSDPLDLASCDSPIGSLANAVELPALRWQEDGDEHAAFCALRALDAALDGKRILCSGENDHGVAQSVRWHATLARYLIHEAKVRVIALEMDAGTVAHWDRYLTSGDAADLEWGFEAAKSSLLNVMEYEWFFESLREVQAELPEGERVRLTGFDITVQPSLTIEALAAFLERADPDSAGTWKSGWQTNDLAAAVAHSERFLAELEAQRDAWIAATDEAAWNEARMHAANLLDGYRFAELYQAGNFAEGNYRFREPGMIRNAEAMAASLEDGERLLLVGHNLHCARAMPASGAPSIAVSPALGTHLARSETWGPQYFVLGQLYLRGTHNALGPSGTIKQPFDSGTTSLAGKIAAITEAPALLIGTDAAEPRMDGRQDLMAFGMQSFPIVPEDQFDGFLWVREVDATHFR